MILERPSKDRSPKIEVQNTSYGFRYGAIRKPTVDPDTKRYIRVTLFIAPMYVIFPAPTGWGNFQAFVPVDDEHLMFYYVKWRVPSPLSDQEREAHIGYSGLRVGVELDENFRRTQRKENNWLQDRSVHALVHWHLGVNNEDAAVGGMGPIYDRSGTSRSDVAIRIRRLMLDSVRPPTRRRHSPLEDPFITPLRAKKIIALEAWQNRRRVRG